MNNNDTSFDVILMYAMAFFAVGLLLLWGVTSRSTRKTEKIINTLKEDVKS